MYVISVSLAALNRTAKKKDSHGWEIWIFNITNVTSKQKYLWYTIFQGKNK